MTSTILALSTATTILVLVASLLVLAALMTGVAVWLIRSTRRDSPALGPLEVMGDRSWRRADTDRRAQFLAGARPEGAPDPAPMLDDEPDEGPNEEPGAVPEPELGGEFEAEPELDREVADNADEPEVEVVVEVEPDIAAAEAVDDIEVEVPDRYHRADG